MTRMEFIENVQSFGTLLDFCYEESCDICEDIHTEDSRDDWINECLVDEARNAGTWQELLDTLQNIPTGYDYYVNGSYGWDVLEDSDFEDYKRDVLSWADEQGVWDDEDEEEPRSTEDDDFIPPEEPISVMELMNACRNDLQRIIDSTPEDADKPVRIDTLLNAV